MRALGTLVSGCVLLLTNCDGSIRYHGKVVDLSNNAPVPDASVYLADLAMSKPMQQFIAGSAPDLKDLDPAKTAPDGTFQIGERIAGPGAHEVWLVVNANGYAPYRKLVWKDHGLPDRSPRPIVVTLTPAGAGHALPGR